VKSLVLVNCTSEFKHHRTLLKAEYFGKEFAEARLRRSHDLETRSS
jgi:hypothetical protein